MGELRSLRAPGDRWSFTDTYVEVGRDPTCMISLADDEVSRKHASFTWTTMGWRLRDLGSTNGTWHRCGAVVVRIKDPIFLRQGDLIGLGTADPCWEVTSALRPPARAVRRDAPGEVVMEDERRTGLTLHERRARVIPQETNWMLESHDRLVEVHDQEVIKLGGVAWQLHLPVPSSPTRRLSHPASDHRTLVASAAPRIVLHLEESAGNCVRCIVQHGDRQNDLGVRAPFRLLWILAEKPGAWLDQQEVLRQLGHADRQLLYTYAFRLREVLHEQGELDLRLAERLVELESRRVRVRVDTAH